MSDCDDITDWDCASYQEYQTNGYSSSSVLKLTDKSVVLPTKVRILYFLFHIVPIMMMK